jgi:hypothetical protein
VNRNRGGAALLDEPELLQRIAGAVRAAVPPEIPVTAKMRLGIEDTDRALDCALALEAGGVQELVVHARTRADGYRPLVRWEWIARIREVVKLPLIANGEVWTVADYAASAPPPVATTSCSAAARWPTRCWRGASAMAKRTNPIRRRLGRNPRHDRRLLDPGAGQGHADPIARPPQAVAGHDAAHLPAGRRPVPRDPRSAQGAGSQQ